MAMRTTSPRPPASRSASRSSARPRRTCTGPTATTTTTTAIDHGHDHGHEHDHDARRTDAGDAVLLQLMWLASPALPVGGFSYSEALEAAVDDGRVTGEASAAAWLANQMALAPARADLPVLAQAHAAWQRHDLARVTQLNDFIGRTRETRELRLQSEQMGRSLVEWLRNQAPGDDARLAPSRRAGALAHLAHRVRAGHRARRRQRGTGLACLAVRLGREHGAGRAEGRAAGPARRPAHPAVAGRRACPR